jgi:D-alanyl-lipoteichoic acid acyltransferase DltB (MBOAT superfamily)
MLFNSWEFFVFFVVVYGLYTAMRRRVRPQNVMLLLASYFFYGWWDWRFLGLLLLSTAVDYFVGLRVAAARESGPEGHAKRWLYLSLAVNLGILGTFKYLGFFVESAEFLLHWLGLEANLPMLQVVLPVGISFYTFQTLAYTIDVYRGKVEAERDFSVFALYVCYFPQLVAGPIERAQTLLPQLRAPRTVDADRFYQGALLIFLGLVRKVGIADCVAPVVNEIFSDPSEAGSIELIAGVLLFAIQIYGDFAGYSSIARGTSRMMGIELMENFRHPYFSTNITMFWRRWHISLSSWLRDYLYIPLGGNRGPKWMVYRNLMLTMLLGGLWHGAAWTFVVWGAIHGVALAIHKLWTKNRKIVDEGRQVERLGQLPGAIASWALTMLVVMVAWVFFRAESFGDAYAVLRGIAAWKGAYDFHLFDAVPFELGPMELVIWMTLWLLFIDLPQYVRRDQTTMLTWPFWLRGLVYTVFVLLMVTVQRGDEVPFIYFQF